MEKRKRLKTRKKDALQLSEATEAGKIKAQVRAQLKKPYEVSLREHTGKFLDKLSLDDAIALVLALHAYVQTRDIRQSLFLMISYKLATSPSIVAATSGVIGLAGWGLTTASPDLAAAANNVAATIEQAIVNAAQALPHLPSILEIFEALTGKVPLLDRPGPRRG